MAGVVATAVSAGRAAALPGIALLRADLMPVIVGVLATRFEDQRRQPYAEFVVWVDEDLEALRDAGFSLPKTAQQYVADWTTAGYLIRRPTEAREESVELSRTGAEALRFVASVGQPQSSVNSSRLSNVAALLDDLARDSDPEPTSRIAALQAQRDELDREIAAIEAGHDVVLDDNTARERLREVLRLAGDVPGDFAKVADDLENLNRSLREQIINNEGSRGGVLDEVFAGVDLIEGSDAGRTFNAFHELLFDPVLADRFYESADAILGRAFTADLDRDDDRFLRNFLQILQRESTQVRRILIAFSRSLRRFVQTQEYREHKQLAAAIGRAEQAAMAALAANAPTKDIGKSLDLTSMAFASVGSWRLHNPGEMRSEEEIITHDTEVLDLEQLRLLVRLTEIDFPELQRAVADTALNSPAPTVASVLDRHPASQGLASIVGLALLAVEHGERAAGDEVWSWISVGGTDRNVTAPRYIFATIPDDWSADES